MRNQNFVATSSRLLTHKFFETREAAQDQVDEWNEAEESCYRDDKGRWQRAKSGGSESPAVVLEWSHWADLVADTIEAAILDRLTSTVATSGYRYAHIDLDNINCDSIADAPTSDPRYLNVKLGSHVDEDGHYLVRESINAALA